MIGDPGRIFKEHAITASGVTTKSTENKTAKKTNEIIRPSILGPFHLEKVGQSPVLFYMNIYYDNIRLKFELF